VSSFPPYGPYGPLASPPGGLPAPQRPLMTASAGSMWGSVYLLAGTELAGRSFELFTTSLGQKGPSDRVFDQADTNLKEARRIPGGVGYDCTDVRWLIREAAAETEVERLSQAYGRSMVDLIEEHGVLFWDFEQTRLDIGPLWVGSSPQLITIPVNQTWNMGVVFGQSAPKLDLDHVLRVTLQGRFKHLSAFG
jgi:hypothetical protein